MTTTTPEAAPRTNLAGLKRYWRNDFIAGFSVALVALPLALGIATAAGAPPISGLVSVVVAGLVCTFLRGSHVAINGPGNALIVIVATAFATLGGGASAFPHILGAVVVSGAIQVAMGALRLGKIGDLIPSAVIRGMLAAIGLIIVGKQLHVMFGRQAQSRNPIDVFLELPDTLAAMNPFVALIGIVSVVILVAHPKIKSKWIHFVPAPLWVALVAVPAVWLTNHLNGAAYHVGPELLVAVPEDLIGNLVHPDFSRIGDPSFWLVVMTFTLVGSIENIVSVKAIDKLDSWRRDSNLDRDLVGVGLSTILSGFLGGLPVLTVIARSSVNVNHGGTTGWSNFFMGVVMLVSVVLLSPVIQEIPLAALAGILVYTGFKLAGIHAWEDALRRGADHFVIFVVTMVATLKWGLLLGIVVGLGAELASHLIILGMPPRETLWRLWRTEIEAVHEKGKPYLLRVAGIASYANVLRIRKALEAVSDQEHLIVDFAPALLVDSTVLEYVRDFGRRFDHAHSDGQFDIIGLERHRALASHPDALHVMERPLRHRRLTPRQDEIVALAEEREWEFDRARDWRTEQLADFHFFRIHPIEYSDTIVRGALRVEGDGDGDGAEVGITFADVTFDEGAVLPEVYHTTVMVLAPPVHVPELILEKEELLDRVLELAGFQDIDFKSFTRFSKRYVLKGPDEASIRAFATDGMLTLLENEEEVYHLESNGAEIVVFKYFRLASPREIRAMLEFGERLIAQVVADAK